MFFHNKKKIDLKKDSLSEAVGKKIDNKNISDKTLAKIYYTTFNLLKYKSIVALNKENALDLIKTEISQHLQNIIMTNFPTELKYRAKRGEVTVQAWMNALIQDYVKTQEEAKKILIRLIALLDISNQLDSSITTLNYRRDKKSNQKFDRLVEYLINIKIHINGKIHSYINDYTYGILKGIVTNPRATSQDVFKKNIPEMYIVLKTALNNKLTDLIGAAFDRGDIKIEAQNNKTRALTNDLQYYRDAINSLLPIHLRQQTEKEAKRKAALDHITNEMEILDESKDRSNDDSIKPGEKLIVCKINEEFLTESECNEKNITFHDKIKYKLKYVNDGIYKTECDKLQKRFAAI